MTADPLWPRAASFALRAHGGQVRKDGSTPYAAHPVRVAMTIACVFDIRDEMVLAAALLHDVIEDCGTDYDDLLETFGEEVADLVACVSKDMRMIEHEREAAYDRQLAAGPWQARLIKLADVYDNLADTVADGRDAASITDKVERALALTKDDSQLEQARRIVREALDAAMRNPASE